MIRPRGRGFVELAFENARGPLPAANGDRAVVVLQYPQSGTLVGAPPRDVQNAAKLREAAAELNRVLMELAS